MLDKAYKDFELYVRLRHKKQGSYNIVNEFKFRILPYFNNLDEMQCRSKLLNWQNTILNLNFSNSYNKRLYYVFNLFLDFEFNNGMISHNSLRDIGSFPKKIEQKNTDFYTLDEFNQFIKYVYDLTYKVYFEVLFYSGLRPSEAMALNFNDIHKYYIDINKSLNRHGSREVDTPKNQSSIRKVKIPKFLYKDIMSLYCGSDDLFVFGGHKPLSPTTIDRIKKKACDIANLRVITQHQFRHSHATYLLSKNIPINLISARLGHSSIDTTCKVYLHKDLSQEKRIDKLFSFLCLNNIVNEFKHLLKLISKF